MAIPPSSPSPMASEWPHFSATRRSTPTAWQVTSVPIPSPGRTRTLRFMSSRECKKILFYRGGLRFLAGLDDAGDLLVEQALLAIGQGRELAIHHVQLFLTQRVAHLLAALLQRMPAAVLSQHQLAFRHAHRLRVD